ncbi:hypothetical protein AS850_02305 [Frondihabitans sp. 762G35]|nr:hypothetical protein AS850_02305 [Frondihabitans sp. 762G35]
MVLTAGCNFISPQTTTEQYAPSDGFETNLGAIQIRNAIVFTESGDKGSLSVTLINTSSTDQDVSFQYKSLGSTATATIPVPANSTVSRGTAGGDEQVILDGIGEQPGSLLRVFVQYGTQSGKNFDIPVLDGSLPQYKTLLPSVSPSSVPVQVPSSEPSPAPTS